MGTKENCSLIARESLKKFFGDTDVKERLEKFDEIVSEIVETANREGISPEVALQKATKSMVIQIKQKARQNYLNQQAFGRVAAQVDQFKDKWRGIQSLIAIEGRFKYNAEGGAIYGRREAIQNISMSLLVYGLDNNQIKKFSSGQYDLEIKKILAGEYNEAELGRLDTDLLAVAKNARKMQDHMHQIKNQAGIDVGYSKNRISKQWHSNQGMIRYGEKEWKELARDLFDFEKMGALDDAVIDKRLNKMWVDRTSSTGNKFVHGVSDNIKEIQLQSSTRNMGASKSVHFKDAEASHKYAQEINSEKSLFNTLMLEVERDSAKVAASEVLGPNFSANWNKLMAETEMSNGKRSSLESQFNNTVYGTKGRGDNFGAGVVNIAKKIANMAMLGPKTLLSTLSDMTYGPLVHSADTGENMLQAVGNTMSSILKTFPDSKQAAIQGSVFLNDALDSMFNQNFLDNGQTTHWFDKVSDMYMKATGLPFQSRLFKTANANAFNKVIFDMRGKSFDSLDSGTLNVFNRYGIGADEWKVLSKLEGVSLPDGRQIIDVMQILDTDLSEFGSGTKINQQFKRNELATNYNAMLIEHAEGGSPTPNSQTMHYVDQSDPNTPLGMSARLAGQFKSFAFAMPKTLDRIKGADGFDRKAGTRLAVAVIGATTIRYAADYLKAIADGKEPPDATDPLVWAKSATASGVGGIMADFLTVDYSTNIWRDPIKDLAGPGARILVDAVKGTIETGKIVGGLTGASSTLSQISGGDLNERDDDELVRKNTLKVMKRMEKTIALPYIQNRLNKEIFDHIHLLMNTGARR